MTRTSISLVLGLVIAVAAACGQADGSVFNSEPGATPNGHSGSVGAFSEGGFGDASVIFDPKDEGAGVEKGGSTKMLQAIPVAPPKAPAAAPRSTAPVAKPAPAAKPAPKPAQPAKRPAPAPVATGRLPTWVIPAVIVVVILIAVFIFLLK